MAAFSPPLLDLHIPDLLRELFRHCECLCVAGCCGVNAFDVTAEQIGRWLVHVSPVAIGLVQGQFERLLGSVAKHRGPVQADDWHGCFNAIWQTPHDCLTYFTDWRQAIAEAVRGMDDPPFFSPSWLTETVVALRTAIVTERAFDRLPILADVLEEVGCDNHVILDHLRANDEHEHHCWMLDMLNVGGRVGVHASA